MNHVKLILRALLAPVFLAALLAASTSVASASPPNDGLFIAVAPARIADTRPAPENVAVPVGKVGNGNVLIVPVAGAGGLPTLANMHSVVLNVTAVNPDGPGFLTVYSNSYSFPTSSNVNYVAGETRANQVTVPVGADGSIRIFPGVNPTDIVVDVYGYYSSTTNPTTGLALTSTLTPHRVLDSRAESLVGAVGPYAAGSTHNVCMDTTELAPVFGLNVTLVNPSSDAFLTIWPAGTTRPTASNLNGAANTVVSNMVTVATAVVGSERCVSIYTNAATQVVVDVVARWDTAVGTLGRYVPLATLTRFYDTRASSGYPPTGVTPAKNSIDLEVGGRSGIPVTARGVLFNLTAVDTFGPGYLEAYSAATCPRPLMSNVNYVPNRAVGNAALSGMGTSCAALPAQTNAITIYHHAGGYLVLDMAGYFTGV